MERGNIRVTGKNFFEQGREPTKSQPYIASAECSHHFISLLLILTARLCNNLSKLWSTLKIKASFFYSCCFWKLYCIYDFPCNGHNLFLISSVYTHRIELAANWALALSSTSRSLKRLKGSNTNSYFYISLPVYRCTRH